MQFNTNSGPVPVFGLHPQAQQIQNKSHPQENVQRSETPTSVVMAVNAIPDQQVKVVIKYLFLTISGK